MKHELASHKIKAMWSDLGWFFLKVPMFMSLILLLEFGLSWFIVSEWRYYIIFLSREQVYNFC